MVRWPFQQPNATLGAIWPMQAILAAAYFSSIQEGLLQVAYPASNDATTQECLMSHNPKFLRCHTTQSSFDVTQPKAPSMSHNPKLLPCHTTQSSFNVTQPKLLHNVTRTQAPSMSHNPKLLRCHTTQTSFGVMQPKLLQCHTTQAPSMSHNPKLLRCHTTQAPSMSHEPNDTTHMQITSVPADMC